MLTLALTQSKRTPPKTMAWKMARRTLLAAVAIAVLAAAWQLATRTAGSDATDALRTERTNDGED